MKRWKKALLGLTLTVWVFSSGAISPAWAKDDYPARPVTLLCGFAPGGSADIQARLLAELLGKYLGQRMVVEYKAGLSGAIMANYLVRQKPDGYTIATMPGGTVLTVPFTTKVEYSYRDLTYIAGFCRLLHGVAVRSDAPWKSFSEFIDHAKKNPGKIRYSTFSPISTTSFMMSLVAREKGIEWLHVPYKSDGQAATALLGGHVEAVATASGMVPYIQSGQFRLLAVFNQKRFPEYPDVPTIQELGYHIPNLSHRTTLTGIVGPKGLTGEPLARLSAGFKRAFQEPSFKKMMAELSAPIDLLDSKEYEKEIADSFKVVETIYPPLLKEAQKQ